MSRNKQTRRRCTRCEIHTTAEMSRLTSLDVIGQLSLLEMSEPRCFEVRPLRRAFDTQQMARFPSREVFEGAGRSSK